uniref:Uncharacterized protein n=1 Tax=Arundo donax TaxID=35708 RepID=A0A0A9D3I5_ARUDO
MSEGSITYRQPSIMTVHVAGNSVVSILCSGSKSRGENNVGLFYAAVTSNVCS